MKGLDTFGCFMDCRLQLRGERGLGFVEFCLADFDRIQRAVVLLLAQLQQRRIAARAHAGDDLLDATAQIVGT